MTTCHSDVGIDSLARILHGLYVGIVPVLLARSIDIGAVYADLGRVIESAFGADGRRTA